MLVAVIEFRKKPVENMLPIVLDLINFHQCRIGIGGFGELEEDFGKRHRPIRTPILQNHTTSLSILTRSHTINRGDARLLLKFANNR